MADCGKRLGARVRHCCDERSFGIDNKKNGTALTVVQGNKGESIAANGSSTCKHPG
jgi:hypothetical protein